MHKQQGWQQALEYCQAKPIQTLGRASQGVNWSWSQCIKSHHTQTSSGKGLPSHFWNSHVSHQATSEASFLGYGEKNWTVAQWSKVLFSDESKFCISFGNQVPRIWRKSVEAQNPCCLKSSVMFLQSVMIWAAMSSAGVGPHTVFSEVQSQRSHLPGNFRALYASFCWQALLWRCWFHFPAGLATCPHCQRYQKMVQWHGVTVLDWPANTPDSIENLCGIVKRKMRHTRTNNADDLKAAMKATWASITPEQCHRLIASMPRRIDAVIHAKRRPNQVLSA